MSQLTDQMKQSAAWLIEIQHTSGGWGETAGAEHLSTLNTAEALTALVQADHEAVGTDPVVRAVEFLRARQTTDGQDEGAWCRAVEHDDAAIATPDVMRTGVVLDALTSACLGPDDEAITTAVCWLRSVQNEDGGWGYTRGATSKLLPTCQALLGLMAAHGQQVPNLLATIERSLLWLGEHQQPRGFFSGSNLADDLAAPHTILAIMVLQRARVMKLINGDKPERAAIEWLLGSQDKARRLVAEKVELEPSNHYEFLYVTDSLLVRVLKDAPGRQDARSALYRAALYSIKDRIEPSRGVCAGYRGFTWATARSISGISVAATVDDEFPRRLVESGVATRVRPWLTVLMLLVLALAAALGFSGHFDAQLAGFFSIMVLVLLFVTGKIGDDLFARLMQSILGGRKSHTPAEQGDQAANAGNENSDA